MKKKKIVAFVHIEKAAGTSVIHMLRDSFYPAYVDVRPVARGDYWFKSSDLDWYKKVMPWIKVIGGHALVPYTDLEQYYDVKYFTVLRDPVDRYISQYRYWRSALGKDLSFEDFLDKSDSWNMQSKKICKDRKATTAIQVLQEKFIAYGLVENMELFVADLAEYFNCEMSLQRKNLTKNKVDKVDELKEAFLQAIIERNEEDIALYNWVKSQNEQKKQPKQEQIKQLDSNSRNMLMDYVFRKSFCEPVSGVKRVLYGLPYRGSYGIDIS